MKKRKDSNILIKRSKCKAAIVVDNDKSTFCVLPELTKEVFAKKVTHLKAEMAIDDLGLDNSEKVCKLPTLRQLEVIRDNCDNELVSSIFNREASYLAVDCKTGNRVIKNLKTGEVRMARFLNSRANAVIVREAPRLGGRR